MRLRFAAAVTVLAACAPSASAAPLTGNGRIAFTDFAKGHFSIYSMRTDGTDRRRLSDARVDAGASWAPDGKHLVFRRQRAPFDLMVMQADGLDEHRVAKTRMRETQPAWSPDGTRIAFVRQLPKATRSDVCIFDFRDRHVRCVTRSNAAFTSVAKPTWSPDMKRIAFAASSQGRSKGIYVINIDRTGLRRLTRGRALDSSPAWSSDGVHIAFSSARAPSLIPLNLGEELYVMNADGSHRTRLTRNGTFDGFPAWAPDGRRIAFSRFATTAVGSPVTLDIFTMDANGGDVQRVTATASAHESEPTWQPVSPPPEPPAE
jgi:Tol biopolymer transport system component